MRKILCSACLLGVNCKYDGGNNACQKILDLAKEETLVPVCPEQLGGLPTPRPRACLKGGGVVDEMGNDATKAFKKGAVQVLEIAKKMGIGEAIMKQKSPSCGCGRIYAGFNGKMINGYGVTAELLRKNGIKVFSEDDF